MNESMDGRDLLAEAIREETLPRVCREHPLPVHYDERVCPCCKIQDENRGRIGVSNGCIQHSTNAKFNSPNLPRHLPGTHRAGIC
jgi:hypothetical protein